MGKSKIVSKGAVKAATGTNKGTKSIPFEGVTKQETPSAHSNNAKERLLSIESIITKELWKRVRDDSEEVVTTLDKLFPATAYPPFNAVTCQVCGTVYDERDNPDDACTLEHEVEDWGHGEVVGMRRYYHEIYHYTAPCSRCGESLEMEDGRENEYLGDCWKGCHISDPKEANRICKGLRNEDDDEDEDEDDEDNEDEIEV